MESRENRLNEVARIAVRLEQRSGCPAQLMIAQWAIESAWGEESVGPANYFDIKKADRHTKCCIVTTCEVINGNSAVDHLEFADYDTLEDSCRDYARLIIDGPPYRPAWEQYKNGRDLPPQVAAVARVCASDPGCARLVAPISSQVNVSHAIAQEAQQKRPSALAQARPTSAKNQAKYPRCQRRTRFTPATRCWL